MSVFPRSLFSLGLFSLSLYCPRVLLSPAPKFPQPLRLSRSKLSLGFYFLQHSNFPSPYISLVPSYPRHTLLYFSISPRFLPTHSTCSIPHQLTQEPPKRDTARVRESSEEMATLTHRGNCSRGLKRKQEFTVSEVMVLNNSTVEATPSPAFSANLSAGQPRPRDTCCIVPTPSVLIIFVMISGIDSSVNGLESHYPSASRCFRMLNGESLNRRKARWFNEVLINRKCVAGAM